jgi:hypothetical protein
MPKSTQYQSEEHIVRDYVRRVRNKDGSVRLIKVLSHPRANPKAVQDIPCPDDIWLCSRCLSDHPASLIFETPQAIPVTAVSTSYRKAELHNFRCKSLYQPSQFSWHARGIINFKNQLKDVVDYGLVDLPEKEIKHRFDECWKMLHKKLRKVKKM